MPNNLTAAIVGAGLMGRWHANAVRKAGGRVAAIVDVDQDAASFLARRYSAAAFTDLNQMLSTAAVDVVHICSPAWSHFRIAGSAIEAGCHVLIEKPMTPAAAETETLYDLAAEHHVSICPVHQCLFQDGVLKARERLPVIGSLIDVQAVVSSAGGSSLPRGRLDEVVGELLPHPLSLIPLFLPGSFSSIRWMPVRSDEGELRALGQTARTTLFIFISMNARPTLNFVDLKGTTGRIHIDLFHGYSFVESGTVSRQKKIMQPFERSFKDGTSAASNLGYRLIRGERAYPGLQRLVALFYESVRTGTAPPISRQEAMRVASVRDCLLGVRRDPLQHQEA